MTAQLATRSIPARLVLRAAAGLALGSLLRSHLLAGLLATRATILTFILGAW